MNTGLDALKTVSKKEKQVDVDAITKLNDHKIFKQEPVEEIIIPLEGRVKMINELRQVLL